MPTKKQLFQQWETEFEFPHTRREDDPMYKIPPKMTNEDKILQSLDNYYSTATKEELNESFERANKLCSSGITWEEYIENLNKSTSINYET